MSNNRSLVMGLALVGVNIAGKPGECCINYTPAHLKTDGTPVSAMAKFTVYENQGPGKDGQDRKETYPLTAWGELADTAAKWFSPGQTISVVCQPESYQSIVRDQQGNPVVIGGVTVMKKAWGFPIERLLFHNGGESTGTIAFEMAKGIRGPGWRDKQTQDGMNYGAFLKSKAQMNWDGAAKTFFYSIIVSPKNAAMIFRSNAELEAYRQANGLNRRSQPVASAPVNAGFVAPTATPTLAIPPAGTVAPNGFVIPALPTIPVAGAAGATGPAVYNPSQAQPAMNPAAMAGVPSY